MTNIVDKLAEIDRKLDELDRKIEILENQSSTEEPENSCIDSQDIQDIKGVLRDLVEIMKTEIGVKILPSTESRIDRIGK